VILYFLAFFWGVGKIANPCILPVLPFVSSRADQSFRPGVFHCSWGSAFFGDHRPNCHGYAEARRDLP
jgi:hypothetical protein